MRKTLFSVLLSAGLSIAAAIPASATPVTSQNYDTLFSSFGTQFLPTLNGTFSNGFGTIVNDVYFNSSTSIYTYTHKVSIGIGKSNIDQFNTSFDVLGFNGVAGYSFSESGAARTDWTVAEGGTAVPDESQGGASDFLINHESDGTLDYNTGFQNDGAPLTNPLTQESGWDSGETVTFFYQSIIDPGMGEYNVINGGVGSVNSYAPAPEPGSMLLFASGLFGVAEVVRRRRKLA